jgi:release factor glutamine methyltransferase
MIAIRALWRWGLRWRFRLFHRRRYRSLTLEYIGGRPFVVLPEVFNPGLFRTSGFLVEQLTASGLHEDSAVLDMGTGSGIGAVFAAAIARHVIAVDINPEAVRCTRINTLLNRVEDRTCIYEGDLFVPVAGKKFDLILLNPPYFRGQPNDAHDTAWRSHDTVEHFAAALPQYLKPGGYALVVLSSDGDAPAFLEAFRRCGLKVEAAARRDLINEVLTVYRLAIESAGIQGTRHR